MPIPIACPACSTRLKVPDEMAGKKVKCPKCAAVLTVAAAVGAGVGPRSGPARPVAPPPPPAAEVEDDEPRKKKGKKKKKRFGGSKAKSSPIYLVMAIVSAIVVAGGLFAAAVAFHGAEKMAFLLVYAAFAVPVGVVVLLIAMMLSSAIAGGIDFGEFGPGLLKAAALVLIDIMVFSINFFVGMMVSPFIWLCGLMVLFKIDFWEARFLLFINWVLNTLGQYFLFFVVVPAILDGKIHVPEGDGGEKPGLHTPWQDDNEGFNEKTVEKLGGKLGYPVAGDDQHIPNKIDFSGTKVTDRHIKQLVEDGNFDQIHYLVLNNTGITDKALPHLEELKNLYEVELKNTKVTDEGVAKLKKAKPGLRIVR